ncbi:MULTISPECIES: fibrobacter succinogenes major paralogous domain-containing protein [Niastella]|uniref:Fibrobacter succinogenes major paralogous domain-containing protein n=1 Tax=Niastella soli TaxID=2821487 RepID=A0ABS3YYF0_9BACT|nr:fibrobacter succinogenes major paralogous domain-containing protein [Niastella soli]MBO9202957.1 fibrobacter succinogenes major paralogous domain-containing protein [Niastella soli]
MRKRINYLLCISLLFMGCDNSVSRDYVTDIDGNSYTTVTIGNKVWMAQNLQVTHYRNGDPIPPLTDNTTWSASTQGAYCNYNNDTSLVHAYGRLYNWHAINDQRNIAPEGWHIPSDEELNCLISWLEKDTASANKFKQPALGGYRFYGDGSYHTAGFNGYWWSTNRSFEMYNWSPRLFSALADVQRNKYEEYYGLSVRCVKDQHKSSITYKQSIY